MTNDTLATVLSKINNYEKRSKKECLVLSSKIIKETLKIMKEERYIAGFEEITHAKKKYLKVKLLGKINNCNVIKPRFSVKVDEYEKYEKRYLPAKDFGIIIVSTTKGFMTHKKAKENSLGGRLIAYCY
ncbi:MAG: 30S ribosomal protein S8 [Candidatus Woesearchaeota archaeon]